MEPVVFDNCMHERDLLILPKNKITFFFFLQIHLLIFQTFWGMWTFFKVFIEFVTTLLLFYVFGFFFGPQACEIPAPRPGIKPTPPALEGQVLTTGPPGKTLHLLIQIDVFSLFVSFNQLFNNISYGQHHQLSRAEVAQKDKI